MIYTVPGNLYFFSKATPPPLFLLHFPSTPTPVGPRIDISAPSRVCCTDVKNIKVLNGLRTRPRLPFRAQFKYYSARHLSDDLFSFLPTHPTNPFEGINNIARGIRKINNNNNSNNNYFRDENYKKNLPNTNTAILYYDNDG